MHLTLDQYLLALRGVMPWELLLQQGHHHLMQVCPVCRDEWDGGRHFAISERATDAISVTVGARSESLAGDPRGISSRTICEAQSQLSRRRAIARRAREDLARLRQQPMESWPEMVSKASTRFRSRAFLELLVETARSIVRNAPREAEALTSLVLKVLDQTADSTRLAWTRVLHARAGAHRANALRVAGDLPAAERVFAQFRGRLENLPLPAVAEAEIASLEASLRMDQRRFSEADHLLTRACSQLGREAFDSRLLIKRANLSIIMGRLEESLASYELAAQSLDSASEPGLHPVIVSGRVNALCDLGRYEEAEHLLAAEGDAFAVDTDPHAAALHRLYSARIALGLGELTAAEEGFASSRDQFLALDRDYDAVSTSLYLADTLLAARKTTQLRKLAADLVPLFRSRGVERETLASLRLLAEAAKAETLTAALLTELRRSLDGRTRAEPRGVGESDT